MADSAMSQAALAADILEKHWRIRVPVVRTHLGVSRATWRIGQFYWLSQAEHNRSAEIVRQANLLLELNQYLKGECSPIAIPEIVASQTGALVVADAEYVWCLTRHLPRFHPKVTDASTYPALMEGLARFHRVLEAFERYQSPQVPDGICSMARRNIERQASEPFTPFTSDPYEARVLQQAAEWLAPRLDGFALLPRQIVHGDWTPRNVLFDNADPPHSLIAVLDFEAVARDPVCVDVANTCSTLLMWSGLDNLDERIDQVLDTYERSASMHLEKTDIHTAMVGHWFCHYWSWRNRLQTGEFGHEVIDRLCLRISSALSYVSTREAPKRESN